MILNKKIIFISSLLLIGLFIFSGIAIAQKPLEILYPPVPGDTVPVPGTTKTLLPDYIRYVFTLGTSLAGLIVFSMLIYGGIRYVFSAGNPAALNDAKGQIMAGLLGTVVIISSYLILTTVNPQLTMLRAEPAPFFGITIYNSQGDVKRIGVSQNDLGDFSPTRISIPPESQGNVKVRLYSDVNFNGNMGEVTGSTDTLPIQNAKSLLLAWQNYGVYLYGNSSSEELWSNINLPLIGDRLHDNVKRIKIKSFLPPAESTEAQQIYGAILHEDAGYQGQCRIFPGSTDSGGEITYDVVDQGGNGIQDNFGKVDKPSSATVFIKKAPSGGAKVTICDQPEFNGACTEFTDPIETPQSLEFGINDNVRSIRIDGNYMAVLTEHAPGESNFPGKCQVFNRQSDPDLKNDSLGQCDVDCFLFWCNKKPCTSGIAIYPVEAK